MILMECGYIGYNMGLWENSWILLVVVVAGVGWG